MGLGILLWHSQKPHLENSELFVGASADVGAESQHIGSGPWTPNVAQAHAPCHHRGMAFQQSLERAQAGRGQDPCQGHCRRSGGRKLPGQESKTTGFCHLFSDARFLINGFATTSIALSSAARPGWLKMPDASGTDYSPRLGGRCLSSPWEDGSGVTVSHTIASSLRSFSVNWMWDTFYSSAIW